MENEIKQARGTGRERVYTFIVEFMKKNGYAPSVREICVGTNLSSTSSVHNCLAMLKMMGKIDMKENTPRSIRVIRYMQVLTAKDIKRNEYLKREVYKECAEMAKDYLSPEQLKEFEHIFYTVAEKYLFGEKKKE